MILDCITNHLKPISRLYGSGKRSTDGEREPQNIPSSRPYERLYALIIGINKYQHLDHLCSAVADADAVHDFLKGPMCVPETRLQILKDKDATREQILNSLQKLASNKDIKRGDPILIFYAGHGAQAMRIEMICPYDFDRRVNQDSSAQGIPDQTLGHLLDYIARHKGNNIASQTVVLDCCHAGSGTRGPNQSPNRVRRVELPVDYVVSPKLDRDLLKKLARSRGVDLGDRKPGTHSHILLAACRKDQVCQEDDQQGFFTRALLSRLRALVERGPVDITYADLILDLEDIPDQNPQCEGFHKSRVLFSLGDGFPSVFHKITKLTDGGYQLHAGETLGVMQGTRFNVYIDRNLSDRVGVFVAQSVSVSSADMAYEPVGSQPIFPPSGHAHALQIGPGKDQPRMTLRISEETELSSIRGLVDNEVKEGRLQGWITLVDADSTYPDVTLTLYVNQVIITLWPVDEGIFNERGLPYTRAAIDFDGGIEGAQRVVRTIIKAVHFHFHLQHSPTTDNHLLDNEMIHLEAFERSRPWYSRIVAAFNGTSSANLIVGDELTVTERSSSSIDFKVVNGTKYPLYAALFYFDARRLAIDSYHEPNAAGAGKADPCVQPGEDLPIDGDPDDGQLNRSSPRLGQKSGVGVLKLFISTEWTNFAKIRLVDTEPITRIDKPFVLPAISSEQGWHTIRIRVTVEPPRTWSDFIFDLKSKLKLIVPSLRGA